MSSSVKAFLVVALAARAIEAKRRKVSESLDFNGLWTEAKEGQARADLARELQEAAGESGAGGGPSVAQAVSATAAPTVAALAANVSAAAENSNSTLARAAVAPPASPCHTLLWNLAMRSRHPDGWQGARLVLSTCDGKVLHNKTLERSGLVEHRLCLPVLFDVQALVAGKEEDVQWSLTAEEVRTFSGGSAPFKGGFCASDPLPAIQEAALEQEFPKYHPSAWSQWWSRLHQRAVARLSGLSASR